jgi:hypothetical protein
METVFTGLASKPLRRFSPVWPQNHSDGFCRFGIKTGGDSFYRFGIKTCCDSFLQFGLKTGGDGFSWFGLKTGGGFLGWASKPRWWRVSQFGSQNRQLWFGDLGLKITTTVLCFGPQNQAGFDLLVAPQNW